MHFKDSFATVKMSWPQDAATPTRPQPYGTRVGSATSPLVAARSTSIAFLAAWIPKRHVLVDSILHLEVSSQSHDNHNFPETCPDECAERGERAQEHPPPLRDGPLRTVSGQVSHELPLRATRERVHQPGGQALLREGASDNDVAGAVQARCR